MLLDTHHHLDFIEDHAARARCLEQLAEQDVEVVAQTVTPSGFHALGGVGARRSLGFHPWWVTSDDQTEAELALFAEAVGGTRFIGEIGLDHSPRRLEGSPAERQRRALRDILILVGDAARSSGERYVLSLHAVRAVTEVLDLLDETGVRAAGVVPVLHRFGGTSDELMRHLRSGGYLSVHPQMLESKRGRAYVRQTPADRLLLESDLPAGPTAGDDPERTARTCADQVVASLCGTLDALSELRGEDMAPVIARTQAELYQGG